MLPLGAGCSELKTNSGLSILLRCSRNVAFHGAGCGDVVLDVDAMLRCKVRVRYVSREWNLEGMVAVWTVAKLEWGKSRVDILKFLRFTMNPILAKVDIEETEKMQLQFKSFWHHYIPIKMVW